MPRGMPTPISVEDVLKFVDRLKAQALEIVETAPQAMRSEFGFGVTHGYLQAASSLKEMADAFLAEAERREEEFEEF